MMKGCKKPVFLFVLFLLFASSSYCFGEAPSGGRGSIFLNLHTGSLTSFSPLVIGSLFVLGGQGGGEFSSSLRLGGGGGAGMLFFSSTGVNFGMGYGGITADLSLTKWLGLGLLVGIGGYAIVNAGTTIASGGFLVLHPTLSAEINLTNTIKIAPTIGYFGSNEARFQSMTVGLQLYLSRFYQ